MTTDTPTTNDTRRLGAMTAIVAMLKLEQLTQYHRNEEDSAEAFLHYKAAAIQSITDAAGPLPPFLSGFIETIAEVLHCNAEAGAPDLLMWKPEAAMTAEELGRARQEVFANYAASKHFEEGAQ